jgi:hypothetical protein
MSTEPGRNDGQDSGQNLVSAPPEVGKPVDGFGRFTAWLLGRPWWQGVGVLMALIVAAVTFVVTGADNPDQAPSTQTNVGDCNAQGSGNVVTCIASKRQSFGQVSVGYDLRLLYFRGTPEELPVPPDYPAKLVGDHCDYWREWIAKSAQMYVVNPFIGLEMLAGEADLVVIKDIEATVFSRAPMAAGTYLSCRYGGGDEVSYRIDVNTVTNGTTVSTFEGPELIAGPAPMPPASIQLSRPSYQYAAVSIDSMKGYLYEGMLTIQAVVNGEEKEYRLGTVDQPLRWLLQDEETITKTLDWHPHKRRWSSDVSDLIGTPD